MSQADNSRAQSLSRGSQGQTMPALEKKFKIRGGSSIIGASEMKKSARNRAKSVLFAKSKRAHDESFYPTSSRLHGENFKHHDPELCVCSECFCGRHMCQLHIVKPDMTKNSIYRQDFLRKKPVQNKINISVNYDRLQGPNLNHRSTYLKDFKGKGGDAIERPIPEDLLKTGGPCNKLSSYSSGFPGYKGVNQYVKLTEKHRRGQFPLSCGSTYSKSFVGSAGKKDDYKYMPDCLKTGENWYGGTTYGDKFQHPNPQDYATKYKITEKVDEKPDDKHQYQTTYRNDFIPQQKTVCPAKVVLEAKAKGLFTNSKSTFSQNSDFKALSPQYHAIATSKHCYV